MIRYDIRSSSWKWNPCKTKRSKHGQNHCEKLRPQWSSTPGRLPWGKDFHRGRLDCLDSTKTPPSKSDAAYVMQMLLHMFYILWLRYGWDMVEIWLRYGWDMVEIWLRYGCYELDMVGGQDVLFTSFYLFALAWIKKIDVNGQAQM